MQQSCGHCVLFCFVFCAHVTKKWWTKKVGFELWGVNSQPRIHQAHNCQTVRAGQGRGAEHSLHNKPSGHEKITGITATIFFFSQFVITVYVCLSCYFFSPSVSPQASALLLSVFHFTILSHTLTLF